MQLFLAHGQLGIWDELIFLGITVVFALIMLFSWLRSRQLPDEDAEEETPGETERFGLD